MNIIRCEQGGAEWFDARMGVPTGSRFCDIVSPTGKPRSGLTPRRYLMELLGERLTLQPADHHETDAMRRGTELEPKAREWYSFATGRAVEQVGFVKTDCGRWGVSPDGLMPDRGLEIKCPLTPTFLEIAESGKLPDDHFIQVQAGLWVTRLPAWDYVIWTDTRGLSPVIITVEPSTDVFAGFNKALPEFCDTLDAMEAKMRAAGHGYTPPPVDEGPSWDEIIGKVTVA